VGDESWRPRGTTRQRRRGDSVGRECPLPTGGRAMPPPRIFFVFELKIASLCAFWELISLHLNCLSYTHKPVSLWLVKPAIASLCVKKVGDVCMTVPLGLKSGGHGPLSSWWIRHCLQLEGMALTRSPSIPSLFSFSLFPFCQVVFALHTNISDITHALHWR